MRGRPELWDRVAAAPRPVPPGIVPLGRYQIPAGARGLIVGSEPLAPGAYLAAGAGQWTLRHGAERWPGGFGAAPAPAALVMESVAVIAGKVRELHRASAPLSDWTDVPPMVNGVAERLRPHRLEEHLRFRLGHLRAVCRDPHARLRTEDVLVPVSKARRITWRTVVHLAAHSETWAARRLHGVEPARLLVPVQVADHDLYENRVVATLVDRLWMHVLARIAEIEGIDHMVRQGPELLGQAESRPDFRAKQRLYAFIAELIEQDDLSGRIEERRRELVALRGALAPLLSSELRAGVRGPYTGPPRLRPTNLFDNQVGYRHCRRLWDVEVASRPGADGAAEPAGAMDAWCRDFAHYALVLVLRAAEQLGLAPSTTEGPEIGRPGPAYSYRGHAVRLDWNRDDTFSLLLGDEPVLRIVPVAHALTWHTDPGELDQQLDGLRNAADGPTAVLYPGERKEREALPPARRLAVHGSSGDPGGLPAMVPVSPADLGSMGRVARTLRGALDGRIMLAYPAPVPSRVAGADALARRFDWLAWRDGRLLVTRPPPAHELSGLKSALAGLRTRADAARRQGDNRDDLDRLHTDLLDAADQVAKLAICPYCLRRPPNAAAVFAPRDHDTYRCQCPNCHTGWELRRCLRATCERRYPVLTVRALSEQPGGHGDLLDEKFSQELLSVPCWQDARSYICPFCGHCPDGSRSACDRCHLERGD
ncbi:hypothetical protein [Actinomadura sp. NEAU-AAG7]|uniref:hypothetical protein n=1 Tax=Actinomadura sp. NEAU-AAG7 TaxID=2839640 RepID=UPI001BE45934|nr:hypothetical protein [Actinomadura sp. NEAU-AAG7]MBT2207524.1 hypothetical protein [Actinomadura sp. NEAU-AAG7]